MDLNNDETKYFTSYEDLEVHSLMIKDEPRTLAYKKAIMSNEIYFKDKIILDVGCGTGILSVFCAQAGAKKVYAVEASNLAKLAEEIIIENNFENIIQVIQGKIEHVSLPDNIKVDTIVSEWMGFYLFHEGMLDSVLWARDKFLKEDGEMFPDHAAIYIAPCSVPSLYENWNNVYGVSMSSFANKLRDSKYNKPEIMNVQPEDLLGEREVLCWINLKEQEASDLNSFSIQHVVGVKKAGFYQGICMWFDCMFPLHENSTEERCVILSTGPSSLSTHWKQTVIVLPQEQQVDEGEPIAFQLDMNRDGVNNRRYNLELKMLNPDTVEHPVPCSCYMTKCIVTKTFIRQHAENTIKHLENNGIQEYDIDDDDDAS